MLVSYPRPKKMTVLIGLADTAMDSCGALVKLVVELAPLTLAWYSANTDLAALLGVLFAGWYVCSRDWTLFFVAPMPAIVLMSRWLSPSDPVLWRLVMAGSASFFAVALAYFAYGALLLLSLGRQSSSAPAREQTRGRERL